MSQPTPTKVAWVTSADATMVSVADGLRPGSARAEVGFTTAGPTHEVESVEEAEVVEEVVEEAEVSEVEDTEEEEVVDEDDVPF